MKNRRKHITERSRFCTVAGCGKKHEAKGYCGTHYARFTKYGTADYLPDRVAEKKAFVEEAVKFDSDECLNWPFGTSNGYGRLILDGKEHKAHRYIYTLVAGEPPSPDLHAAHGCGNRACCNPRHLRWATALENNHDKFKHGTNLAGEKHPRAKLTDSQVALIRDLKGKVSADELAKQYGVSKWHLWSIMHGYQRKGPIHV